MTVLVCVLFAPGSHVFSWTRAALRSCIYFAEGTSYSVDHFKDRPAKWLPNGLDWMTSEVSIWGVHQAAERSQMLFMSVRPHKLGYEMEVTPYRQPQA